METDMSESAKEKLLSLLFGGEKELVNIKFFPGDNVSSGDELLGAAHEAFSMALANEDGTDDIPGTGREQVPFGELIAKL